MSMVASLWPSEVRSCYAVYYRGGIAGVKKKAGKATPPRPARGRGTAPGRVDAGSRAVQTPVLPPPPRERQGQQPAAMVRGGASEGPPSPLGYGARRRTRA